MQKSHKRTWRTTREARKAGKCQKRPNTHAKETYRRDLYIAKRDLEDYESGTQGSDLHRQLRSTKRAYALASPVTTSQKCPLVKVNDVSPERSWFWCGETTSHPCLIVVVQYCRTYYKVFAWG